MVPMIVSNVESKYRDPTSIPLPERFTSPKQASLNLAALRRHGYETQRRRKLTRQFGKNTV